MTMAIVLSVNEKDYEGKISFKFNSLANEKYSETDKEGNQVDGFKKIYGGLLDGDASYLIAFFDCAFAHLKDRPSLEQIETALDKYVEVDKLDDVFASAFVAFDQSGFFKRRIKNFWKEYGMLEKMGGDEKEQKQFSAAYKLQVEKREEYYGKSKKK
ncbi:tail assembly chaperone [Shouchella clausii]|jgi:hypothetical protein|nr:MULTISPECIES: tail assembly chaperone [Shouchella]MBU3231036.1 tail assembly chaperone [Shouchella clausii]MBU3534919.1 tail assembly chaperone [Shouchella clausii]MBX0310047.1 tail assembly chaperone [Shouchella clausii]MCZ1180120.1 hypothetical protein [Shouchella clausii]MDP5259303.1 tail assembly chaperone [Shouchella clausii]